MIPHKNYNDLSYVILSFIPLHIKRYCFYYFSSKVRKIEKSKSDFRTVEIKNRTWKFENY